MVQKLKTASILSWMIVVLAVLASAGGLLFRSVYRDNAFVVTTWLGNDAVTLFLAVPILAAALLFARRGSTRAILVWMGALDYMLYNYTFYLFGSAFNAFFLIYVAITGLCIFALIYGLANLDAQDIAARFSPHTPVKPIGIYFIFVACGLTVVYLAMSVGYIFTGQLPPIVTTSGHPTSVVFALDLTLLVPWLAVGGLWLIQGRPWGNVLAGILSIKGPLYTLILTVNTLLVANKGLASAGELILWIPLTILGSIAGLLVYRNIDVK